MKKEKTLRFCITCNRNRIFQFNRIIGHSECGYCGGRFAKPFKDIPKEINQIKEYVENRKKDLDDSENNRIRRNELNKLIKWINKNCIQLIDGE